MGSLVRSITPSDTAIFVDSQSGYPAAPFIAKLDDESVMVMAGFDSTIGQYIIARALQGTPPRAHPVGTDLVFVAETAGEQAGLSISFTTPSTGVKGSLVVPFTCQIEKVTILANETGSVVIDVWKDTYPNYDAIDDTKSITASAPITISSGVKSRDATLTGWDRSLVADDVLVFNIDSVTDIDLVTILFSVSRPG